MLGDQSGIISIHALREEGDLPDIAAQTHYSHFYPRPPRGGRPASQRAIANAQPISIHALREEGDRTRPTRASSGWNFYPRPPRGGRLTGATAFLRSIVFLSTPSVRRATRRIQLAPEDLQISIHALREEGDLRLRRGHPGHGRISIHALREEGDVTIHVPVSDCI